MTMLEKKILNDKDMSWMTLSLQIICVRMPKEVVSIPIMSHDKSLTIYH